MATDIKSDVSVGSSGKTRKVTINIITSLNVIIYSVGRPHIRRVDNIRSDTKTCDSDNQMTEDRKVWSTMVATVDTR